MKKINLGPVIAALQHVGSYAAGLVTALVFAGMSHDQAVVLVNSIVQASSGLASVLGALGVLVPIVIAAFAARKATPTEQVKAVEALPDVATIVVKDSANSTVGALAIDKNHPNIVTETQNEKDAKEGTKV